MAGFRKGYADTPFGQVHYAVCGDGPPLVMLGPTPRSYRVFAGLAQALSDFRCIIVDQLGFGESAALPAGGSMEDVADAVVPVLDALGLERADIFGLHSGLKIAAALGARHPRRVGRLVLVGKSHSIAPDMDVRNKATRAVVDRLYFKGGNGPSAEGNALRGWAAQWRNLSEVWWSDAIARSPAPDAMIDATAAKIADDLLARGTITESYRANFAFDLAAAVRRVTCPVTVVEITSAAEDAKIGRQGQALAALAGSGRCVEIAETDPSGLQLYVGVETLAEVLRAALTE